MDNLFNLNKRYYLVTGAAGLLGREHCEAILSANGIPIALDLNIEGLEALRHELFEKYNEEIKIFKCSIVNIKDLTYIEKELRSKDIFISGLINNAAINPTFENNNINENSRLENYDLDKWDLELAVGLKGSYLVSRVFAKQLMSHSYTGIILNISSDLGIIAPDQRLYKIDGLESNQQPVKPITYSVIKTGLIGMTKYFATYFEGKIRSNVLCPGGVQTNQDSAFLNKISKLIPMKRMAKSNEYRGTIIYLLSDASSYMNGSVVTVDGGRTVW